MSGVLQEEREVGAHERGLGEVKRLFRFHASHVESHEHLLALERAFDPDADVGVEGEGERPEP